MPAARELKRRIKSIKNTKKITRAMQMISAVKMRKAQDAALNSRHYSDVAGEIVQALLPRINPRYNALLQQNNKSKRVAVVTISTNRGLVGGFNGNLVKEIQKVLGGLEAEIIADFVVSGKKAREALQRLRQNIVADYPKLERLASMDEVLPIARSIVEKFLKGEYRSVVVVYTQFISTLSQKPRILKLLPFDAPAQEFEPEGSNEQSDMGKYVLEPDPEAVLNSLLPRIIETRLYQAVLENDASEHSARMVMMKNATEAASDLIDDLTLTYNQLRQAGITKELAEISAGRAAIE
jgi:F-type H+-transporting ATPase subunit gamma